MAISCITSKIGISGTGKNIYPRSCPQAMTFIKIEELAGMDDRVKEAKKRYWKTTCSQQHQSNLDVKL